MEELLQISSAPDKRRRCGGATQDKCCYVEELIQKTSRDVEELLQISGGDVEGLLQISGKMWRRYSR